MYVFKYDLFIYFLFQVFSLFINELLVKYLFLNTMNYPKKTRFQSVPIAALRLYIIQRDNLVFNKYICIISQIC